MTTDSTAFRLTLLLTPHGHLRLAPSDDAPEISPTLAERLQQAFARGAGHGLLRLGAALVGQILPPVFAYWREFGGRFVTALCTRPDVDEHRAPPPPDDLAALVAGAPVMPGAEYLTADVLTSLWAEIGDAFAAELADAKTTVQDFLKALNPAWNVVGRVHFNLAENRKDEATPFAFLATYSNRLSAHGKAQHLPLGQALRDSAGAGNNERLLSLLVPVQRAAERCAWLKQMVDAGEIFPDTPQEKQELIGELRQLAIDLDVQGRLAAYGAIIQHSEETGIDGAHYFLLSLNSAESRVTVTGYPARQLDRAASDYLAIERSISETPGAESVLVSVESLSALRRAYPNYFLDTRVFLDALRQALS